MEQLKELKREDYIDTKEAANILAKSVKTVRWYASTGKLSSVKQPGVRGAELRFKRSEVEAVAGKKETKSLAAIQPLEKEANFSHLKEQLSKAERDKERYWQDKEIIAQEKREAEKRWLEQFQYNQHLLNERKQLTEGTIKLKMDFEKDKAALISSHKEDLEKQAGHFEDQLRRKDKRLKAMGWTLIMVLLFGVIATAQLTGVIKIEFNPSLLIGQIDK